METKQYIGNYMQCPICNKLKLRVRMINKRIVAPTIPTSIISTECVNRNCGIGIITGGELK
tara:strand:- start:884 stop:1066 length:183 start_codon:yes stop_codon:yes gene_type:complete